MLTRAQRKIDPELMRQLNAASTSARLVEAVLMLRQTPTQIASNPGRTEEAVAEILQRVKARVGTAPKQINIFRNLGSFVVAAEPSFIRELLTQPEIVSAVANQQPGEATIPPSKQRPTSTPNRAKNSSVGRKQSAKARSASAKSRK